MRRGFINGILAGGIIGAVVTMFVAPQFKKDRRELMHDTRQATHKARRVIRGVKNISDEWMK